MIADLSSIFKKKSSKKGSSPIKSRGVSPSPISNINPEDKDAQNPINLAKLKKANKKASCFGCFLSTKPANNNLIPEFSVYLLPEKLPKHLNKKTLVLDLDETLVHSSFQNFHGMDEHFNIDLGGKILDVYVSIRPGAIELIKSLSEHYELVVFTASQPVVKGLLNILIQYAKPVVKLIDKENKITSSLFREDCDHIDGTYIKNLARLGRDLKDVIILDNSVRAFAMHPENAYHCINYYNDKSDTELYDIIPLLEYLSKVDDVRPVSQKTAQFKKTKKDTQAKAPTISETQLNFEEIDIEEYSTVEAPKKIEIKHSLKTKRSGSGITNGTISRGISLKGSLPNMTRNSSDDSISLDKSTTSRIKTYKTSGFSEALTLRFKDDRNDTDVSEDEQKGKQVHRSIVIKHKEKSRSKQSVVL